jgi:small subunit ribosomal protein S17
MIKYKKIGIVINNQNKKTITVETTLIKYNKKYYKQFFKQKKFLVHDQKNECSIGDLILIEQCNPISKKKKWIYLKKLSI